MNASNHHLDTQLDRLVDGELSPAEYRNLLTALDDQPEGWRRCALAFLEAQALGRDLSAVRQPALQRPAASDGVRLAHDRAGDWSHRTWQGLYFATIAASLALAFYVGSWTTATSDRSAGPWVAENRAVEKADERDTPRSEPRRIAKAEMDESRPEARGDAPLGNVRLVVDGAEASQGMDVPVYGQQQLDRWHTTNKPVLPPQVIEQLRRSGHQVDHRQQWIRLETEDGKLVLLPVDDYQIQPPRRPAY